MREKENAKEMSINQHLHTCTEGMCFYKSTVLKQERHSEICSKLKTVLKMATIKAMLIDNSILSFPLPTNAVTAKIITIIIKIIITLCGEPVYILETAWWKGVWGC